MDNIREGAYRLIKTVATPLHFFVVAVIVMGIIIVVLVWKAKLPPDVTVLLVQISFGVLLVLIILVVILIIFFPKKLIFDKEAHRTVLREQLGDHEFPSRYIGGTLPNVSATDVITDKR